MLSAAEGSPGSFIQLRQDPSAALSMTDFPLNHFQDFEYTLLRSARVVTESQEHHAPLNVCTFTHEY
jgi:hypothetical protein